MIGAVMLLSDGGDNFSGDMQPQIVSRLGAAAKTLSNAGIKTYAIRYGSADGEPVGGRGSRWSFCEPVTLPSPD